MGEPRSLLEQPSANNVGQSTRIEAGNRSSLLDLSGADAAARSVHILITVQPLIALDELTEGAILLGEDVVAARAIVEIGSGGHRASIELDILHGVAFVVSGSSIRVTAINDGVAPVEVGAFAAFGDARGYTPALTRIGPDLAPAETWTLEVPQFATQVEVFARDVALRIDVGRGRTGERWLYAEEVESARRMPRPLPIANGCSLVRITNRGTNVAAPIAIFTLAL
jgi:hypothetical protein